MTPTAEQLEYMDAKALAADGVPLRVLLMAAILTEDEYTHRLEQAYPMLWAETLRRRFDSIDGSLPGDQQTDELAPPITSLDRDANT